MNGELIEEKDMYRHIYSDEDETDRVSIEIFATFSPQVDSELNITFQGMVTDSWSIWIYKDLPEFLTPEPFYESVFPSFLLEVYQL